MSDQPDKITIALKELSAIAKRVDPKSDHALYYNELHKIMQWRNDATNQIAELQLITQTLAEGQVIQIETIQNLQAIVKNLADNDASRAKEIADLAERLENHAKTQGILVEDLRDQNEP